MELRVLLPHPDDVASTSKPARTIPPPFGRTLLTLLNHSCSTHRSFSLWRLSDTPEYPHTIHRDYTDISLSHGYHRTGSFLRRLIEAAAATARAQVSKPPLAIIINNIRAASPSVQLQYECGPLTSLTRRPPSPVNTTQPGRRQSAWGRKCTGPARVRLAPAFFHEETAFPDGPAHRRNRPHASDKLGG